jgi:hypothetical protein
MPAGHDFERQDIKPALPNSWRWVRLGEVITEAQPGFASGSRDADGVIQLRMNNVDTRGNLVWDEFIRVPADKETVAKYQLMSGDVMFNNTNSTELVGKSALFCGSSESIVYSNHFTRLRTDPWNLEPGHGCSFSGIPEYLKIFAIDGSDRAPSRMTSCWRLRSPFPHSWSSGGLQRS